MAGGPWNRGSEMKDILIFSGTTEGRTLARWLASRGVMVHVRVATDYGAVVMGEEENIEVTVGSCGGAEGIASLIRSSMIETVVDATHPFATTVSKHIREGCTAAGAECIRIVRGSSGLGYSDDVIAVGSVKEAVDFLIGTEGMILAATGSKEIAEYTRIPDYRDRVVARVLSIAKSVQMCAEHGFEGKNLICGQGPFTEEMNYATLTQIDARYMVTKDSGTVGGFEEKVRAARRAGAKIVLIRQPDDGGITYNDAVELLSKKFDIEPPEVSRAEGKPRVVLIGIGVGNDGMTVRAAEKLRRADVVIGAKRMLESVDTTGKETLEEYRSKEIIDFLKASDFGLAAILLSGDTGFYSGAKGVLERIDRSKFDVEVECGTSSLSYLCARMGTVWQDAFLASAHGRRANLVSICSTHPKVFTLLTDSASVHTMCRDLFDYGLNDLKVTVGQDFGMPTERVTSGTPSELLDMEFGNLCVAMIENPIPDDRVTHSISDEAFLRGDAPMSKSEVRTLSVQKLWLKADSVVYDVGAGTGSVSIEMAMAAYNGMVYAIEKEEEAASLIELNRRKFRTPNLEVVRGLAPEAFDDLPAPTHAFIGGSSGNLRSIIEGLLKKNPAIRMVINSVTLETVSEVVAYIKELDLVEEETIQVSVARTRKMGRYHLLNAQNPVFITVVRGR